LVFVTQTNILTSLTSTKIYTFASPKRERSPTNFNFLKEVENS